MLSDIRKAVRAGALTSEGWLPVEGRKLIDEAERSGLEIAEVFVREDQDPAGLPGKRIHRVDASTFKSIQSTETSQGLIALVRPKAFTLEDIAGKENALVVVLARLQDPGNVGAILRIAESFGATGCVGLEGTVSPFNPKTVRASAGSVFRLPHIWDVNPSGLAQIKAKGFRIIGTAPDATVRPDKCDWRGRCALIIGNEGSGMNSGERAACDVVVGIPKNPAVDSLNSAIAAAIILYEAARQRTQA